MSDPNNQIHEALKLLNEYYRALAEQVAAEVIAHKEDFQNPELGNSESIVERYAKHAQRVNVLYGILRYEATYAKPEGREPLARDEFRCFGCGEVIKPEDGACKICGWTWR